MRTCSFRFARAVLVLALPAAFAQVGSALAFPWSLDMFRGPQVAPLAQSPRVMPPGTVPTEGTMPKMTLEQESALRNPVAATPDALAAGKFLYDTDCAACHGSSGHGDGPAAHVLRVQPPDLIAGTSAARPDGYIFGAIRNGVGNSPALGDAMSPHEAWEVVLYLRALQGAPERERTGAR